MCNLFLPSQVFVGLGFPYEGPAPIEVISLGCVFLQPRFSTSHSSDSNDFYSGKPTTRQVWQRKHHNFIKTRSGFSPDMSDPRFPPSTRMRTRSLANPTCGQWTWPTRPLCAKRSEPFYAQRWSTQWFCSYIIFSIGIWANIPRLCGGFCRSRLSRHGSLRVRECWREFMLMSLTRYHI